jgi:uncharacterized protein
VRFEWDRENADTNLIKHDVSFDEAVTVFYDPPSATFGAPDHSDAEQRQITIGLSSLGRLVVVCHTERREACTDHKRAPRNTARKEAS